MPLAEPETTGCGSGAIVGALPDEGDDPCLPLEDERSADALDDEDPLCLLPDELALPEDDPLELVPFDFAPSLEEEVPAPEDDPPEPVLADLAPVLVPLAFAFVGEPVV